MAMTCAAVTGMQADGVESLRRNQVGYARQHGVSPPNGETASAKGATTPNSEFRKFRFFRNSLILSMKKGDVSHGPRMKAT